MFVLVSSLVIFISRNTSKNYEYSVTSNNQPKVKLGWEKGFLDQKLHYGQIQKLVPIDQFDRTNKRILTSLRTFYDFYNANLEVWFTFLLAFSG